MNPNNELDRERLMKAIDNPPHPTPPPDRRARKMGGGATPFYSVSLAGNYLSRASAKIEAVLNKTSN